MQVLYKSTRGKEETVTASMAILKGLSEDGGLFVPTEIPKLDVPMDELAKMSYQETAYEVMKCFLTDFTEEELKNCINNAYDEKFDTKEIAPLHEADGAYFLELYHGATIAFKDMALSILPHLISGSNYGNVEIRGTLTQKSDIRLKTIHSKLFNCLDKISVLDVFQYKSLIPQHFDLTLFISS